MYHNSHMICDMSHSYVKRLMDYVTWRIWHVTWLLHMNATCHISHSCMTSLMWYVTCRTPMWHDSWVTWHDVCDMGHDMWRDSYIWMQHVTHHMRDVMQKYVTWRMWHDVCDMTYVTWRMWHVTWRLQVTCAHGIRDMTYETCDVTLSLVTWLEVYLKLILHTYLKLLLHTYLKLLFHTWQQPAHRVTALNVL